MTQKRVFDIVSARFSNVTVTESLSTEFGLQCAIYIHSQPCMVVVGKDWIQALEFLTIKEKGVK